MTDDPLSQAQHAITAGIDKYGRELARNEFIGPTVANDGVVPLTIIARLQGIKRYAESAEIFGGIIMCLIEESAHLTVRNKDLQDKLVAAERTIRNLMEQVIPKMDTEGGHRGGT